jgi:hypothetical protein
MRHKKQLRRLLLAGIAASIPMALVFGVPFFDSSSASLADHESPGSMLRNHPILAVVLDQSTLDSLGLPNAGSTGVRGPFRIDGEIFEDEETSNGGTTGGIPTAIGTFHMTGWIDTRGQAIVHQLYDIQDRGLLIAEGVLQLSELIGGTQASTQEEKLAVIGGTGDFRKVSGELAITRRSNGSDLPILEVEGNLKGVRLDTEDDDTNGGGTTSGTTTGGTPSGTTTGGTTGSTTGETSGGITSGTTTGETTGSTTSGTTTSGTTSGGTTSGTTTSGTTGGTTAGGTTGSTTTGGTTGSTTAGGTTGSTTSGTTGSGS